LTSVVQRTALRVGGSRVQLLLVDGLADVAPA
jgi:hypothetical protein